MQIVFPKTPHGVRLSYVVGLLVRMSISAALIVFLVKQTVSPTVDRLVANIQAGRLDPLEAAESLVKLAIPNTYIWLLVFYFYFHLFMNLLAELLCFGDRVFYKVRRGGGCPALALFVVRSLLLPPNAPPLPGRTGGTAPRSARTGGSGTSQSTCGW